MTVVIVVLVVVVLAAGAFYVSRRRQADDTPSDPTWSGGAPGHTPAPGRVPDPHHGEVGGRGAGPVGGP